MNLNELGIEHGTDKSTLSHGYLFDYEKLFPDRNEVKNVLEIGILCGKWWKHSKSKYPSLKMWKEWFPNATIYGFDLKNIKSEDERIIIYQGNQASEVDITKLRDNLPELDLLVDDGSHKTFDQLLSFMVLSPKIKQGGYYVIEDLHSKANRNDEKLILGRLKEAGKLKGWEVKVKDSLRTKENIAFLRKK